MSVNNDKILKLIKLYESVIDGDNNRTGILDHCDPYYNGCWDTQLGEIETLKNEIIIQIKETKQ